MLYLAIAIIAAAAVLAILACAPMLSRSPIRGGIVGLITGSLLGLIAGFLQGAMHWFGPVDIPDPVFIIGDIATTLSTLYPVISGAVGLTLGVVIGAIRK